MAKEKCLNRLTATQRAGSLAYFDKIYACHELTSREENILFLGCIWENGFVLEELYGND